jgi:transposase
MGASDEHVTTVAATVAATDAAAVQRIEIVGDRRRAHDAAFRARMVAESLKPGVRVQDLARRHDVCSSLIYRWRREAAPQVGAASGVQLVPVQVRVSEAGQASKLVPARPAPAPASAETIEIELAGGVRLRVSERIGTAALRRIVAALRA